MMKSLCLCIHSKNKKLKEKPNYQDVVHCTIIVQLSNSQLTMNYFGDTVS